MRVSDIYKNAVALCGSNDTTEYEDYAVPTFNLLLGETFNENNQLRQYKGKEALEDVPQIETTDDEMPYEDELRTALGYGWAARLLIADSDMDEGKHLIYMQLYTASIDRLANKAIEESVVDVYAES